MLQTRDANAGRTETEEDFWNGRQVLVTGAGGFIGSHLCEALVTRGARVRALIRYNSRNSYGLLESVPRETLAAIEIVSGDLLDEASLAAAVKGSQAVFHLAAIPSIPYSNQNPRHVFATNLQGSLNVLFAARDRSVESIVLASSGGASEKRVLSSPFITSKAAMEKVGIGFYQSFKLPVRVMRSLNNYGPRQSARAIVPTIISQALERDDVHLGALEPTMDFNFVGDTVGAFMRAAEVKEAEGRVLTWGTGVSTSIGDLAQMIFGLMGRKDLHVVVDAERVRPFIPPASLLEEIQDTHACLGTRPATSLEAGLRTTIDWMAQHPELYKTDVYNI